MTPEEPNRKAAFGGATFFILDGLFLCATQSGWRHWFGVLAILLGITAYVVLLWQTLHQAQKKADNSPRTAATSPHTFTPDPPVQPLIIDPPARTLTPAEQEKLRALIAILHQAGIFAPEAPAATDLAAAVADWGEVELEAVLSAILETAYYHPEFQESRYNANLAYIETDCEQDESSLRDEIDDLLRLADCKIHYTLHCDETNHHANGFMLHLHMTHGEHTLNLSEYHPCKAMSETLYSGIARFLYESGAPRRLICYWSDTLWLSSLPATDPQALAYLNQQLGLDAENAWRYLDDESQ